MASFVAQPVIDALEERPAPERLNLSDGALLTEAHFRDEQLYHRGQVSRLALHLHGSGTVAGLDVRYDPVTGTDIEVKVAPGLAIDRLGRMIELSYESCLNVALWMTQQGDTPETAALLQAGLRAAGGGLPEHVIVDVYLSFHACARQPEPAFADANAETIDGVTASRIRDAGRLQMVIRPDGDDRTPASLPAANLPDPVTLEDLRAYKRTTAWDLTQPETAPFSLPAGGSLSEHIVAGNRQDGSEVLLARLTLPVVTAASTPPRFDDSIDLSQPAFVPNQDIRPYSYAADELALLLASARR